MQASMPAAMGKSKAAPSFFVFAGARLTVICFDGISQSVFLSAVLTLSFDSLTALSGSPTMSKAGKPLLISTSVSTR